jgi:3-methyladenine DNA glycosylase AlkC
MKDDFSENEIRAAEIICAALTSNRVDSAISLLRALKDEIYSAIAEKQRIGRGITWVVQRIARLFARTCGSEANLRLAGLALTAHLTPDDILLGVPIFMLGEYGENHPTEIYEFFTGMADSPDWVVREFAQAGFRPVITPNRETVLPWLKEMATDESPNRRRFVAEALRPVTTNHWITKEPDYSLGVLRLMFREAHPYPRTSVGNNLSDLSRRQPEVIYAIVKELVELQDDNSTWIAARACRNLVKADACKVMDLLGVEEYHYKDRHYTNRV